jgi:hypothetical protein
VLLLDYRANSIAGRVPLHQEPAQLAGLFAILGFEGDELDMRTRTYVCYYSLEAGINIKQSRAVRIEQAGLRNALLTSTA